MARPRRPDPLRNRYPSSGPQPPDLRVLHGELQAPEYPDDLSPAFAEMWDLYWASDLAKATFSATDFPAFHRLFWLYGEMTRLERVVEEMPFLEGSKGQTVVNPAYRVLPAFMSEARLLEDRFGLSPKSRVQLGLALGGAKASTLGDLIAKAIPEHQHVLDGGCDVPGCDRNLDVDPRF